VADRNQEQDDQVNTLHICSRWKRSEKRHPGEPERVGPRELGFRSTLNHFKVRLHTALQVTTATNIFCRIAIKVTPSWKQVSVRLSVMWVTGRLDPLLASHFCHFQTTCSNAKARSRIDTRPVPLSDRISMHPNALKGESLAFPHLEPTDVGLIYPSRSI
jgi:hypothetical protein